MVFTCLLVLDINLSHGESLVRNEFISTFILV